MKKYEMYKCEICETMFNEKKKAVECEKSHITDFEITHKRYIRGVKFPVAITVTNGSETRIYK